MLIGNELVRELVETVIMTGKLRGSSPVSLLLIATPESGKTSVVLSKPCKNVKPFTDITGRGLQIVLQAKPEITHIVINDMVAVLSHKTSVNKYTMSVLNAITEEGVMSIATPSGIEDFPIGKKGVITSLTTDLVGDSRNWWNKVGFTSRMLPFCYSYPENLVLHIKDSIDHAVTNGKNEKAIREFTIPKNEKSVVYCEEFNKRVRRIADVRSSLIDEIGLRRLKQYHSLVQAHALLRNHSSAEVTEQDVEFLEEIDLYCSYDKPKALHIGDNYAGLSYLSEAKAVGI